MTTKNAVTKFYEEMSEMLYWAFEEQKFPRNEIRGILEENMYKLKESIIEEINEKITEE